MKKLFFTLVAIALTAAVLIPGCGKNNFGAYESALSELISAKEKFISDAAGAANAQALKDSTKAYISGIDKFLTTRTDLFMKHPGLTDRGPYPESFEKLRQRSSELDTKVDDVVVQAIQKFQNDPGVISTWEELVAKKGSI